MKKQKKEIHYRDAITGEYVTEAYALEHPDTTVKETEDPKRSKDDGEGEE